MSVKKKKSRSSEADNLGKTPKVGNIFSSGGVAQTITNVTATKGGGHIISSSGEPAARERGYRIQGETLGFKIEHFPPTFVPKGTPRKPSNLSRDDWDFSALLMEPIEIKRLALFHELCRESSRMREACRKYEEAQRPSSPKGSKRRRDHGDMITDDDFRDDSAESFLHARLGEFPYGVRSIQTVAVASDTGWNSLRAPLKKELLSSAADQEKRRLKESPYGGLSTKDVPGEKPMWPFENPIEVANEWDGDNRPRYVFNSGVPGLPELTPLGGGDGAGNILSESVDLCICFNFRDEEIIETFTAILKAKRQALPEALRKFSVSRERRYTKLKSNNVDAVLKGLAALRLRAAMPAKEAAAAFHDIYFPAQTARARDIGNVQKQAQKALEWQRMFLRHCPLDSAPKTPRGPWDLECSLCFRITAVDNDPGIVRRAHLRLRCPECDHRETVIWDGQKWVQSGI